MPTDLPLTIGRRVSTRAWPTTPMPAGSSVPRANTTSMSVHFGAADAVGTANEGAASRVAVPRAAIIDAVTARRTHRIVMPTDTVSLLDLESSY